MFTAQDFVTCVQENLKAKGFHNKRIKEITDAFDKRAEGYAQRGMDATSASMLAMKDTFENMTREAQEKSKRTAKMLSIQAANGALLDHAANVDVKAFTVKDATGKQVGPRGSRGEALARAAISTVEEDPRFPNRSFTTDKGVNREQLYAIFGDVLNRIGKGVFGKQKGAAHLPNIIREVFGQDTGDMAAKQFADAWLKVSDLGVDLFNQAGGSMRRLERFIPQRQNVSKIVKDGEANFVAWHLKDGTVDWNRTTWPDGTQITPDQREGFFSAVHKTKSTDGAWNLDDKAFRGAGSAIGNQLDNNRLIHYASPEAWLEMHAKYGDGNIFDVFTSHIEDMAHKIALVNTFGPNPELTSANFGNMVRKRAAALGPQELARAEGVLKNKYDPMMETALRQNPMNPESITGTAITSLGNTISSAILGSMSFLAIPGDFMQTTAVRALNNMGLFDGVGYYTKAMLSMDKSEMRALATQSGFVHDEMVSSVYSAQRFSGVATIGANVSRHLSEAVMRASAMTSHTTIARWTVQREFMGMMHRMKSTAFPELPFRQILERHGITAEDWDAFRSIASHEPVKDVPFLRPIDLVNSEVANGQALYSKFQGMIYDEARYGVPDSTIEATVSLKGTSRPDTLMGALLYSFAMYKNFPLSFAMIYGRLGMTSPTAAGRLKFYAGLGAGMTVVGALGTQMREISKGRDPLPMDNAAFLGKAFLSGGALSIWGDFLFGSVNQFGRSPAEQFAGPLAGFLGDTTNLLLGDTFQWAGALGSLSDKEFKSTTASRAVEYAKRYTPGSSLWYARLALERQVWDRLTEIADPKAYRKRQQQMAKQKNNFGNGYWWAPGDRTPDRTPQL